MPAESNGVTTPATAVKEGGNTNNDQASVGKPPKSERVLPNGNIRTDR